MKPIYNEEQDIYEPLYDPEEDEILTCPICENEGISKEYIEQEHCIDCVHCSFYAEAEDKDSDKLIELIKDANKGREIRCQNNN